MKFRYISWIAVILWMIFIFCLSSQEAEQSNRLSKDVAEVIVSTIEKVAPNVDFDIRSLNNTIRKNAHFFTYLVLGILTMVTFRISGARKYKSFTWAFTVCTAYAILDEVHQLFVPGRGSQFTDVVIDAAGAAVGIGLYLIAGRIYHGICRKVFKADRI